MIQSEKTWLVSLLAELEEIEKMRFDKDGSLHATLVIGGVEIDFSKAAARATEKFQERVRVEATRMLKEKTSTLPER